MYTLGTDPLGVLALAAKGILATVPPEPPIPSVGPIILPAAIRRRESKVRLARLLGYETRDGSGYLRELYQYNCPENLKGHYNIRLVQNEVEGRELHALVPCNPERSLSSISTRIKSGSASSGSSEEILYYMGRLIQAEEENRELYAAENPCCPTISSSSISVSSSSASVSSASLSSVSLPSLPSIGPSVAPSIGPPSIAKPSIGPLPSLSVGRPTGNVCVAPVSCCGGFGLPDTLHWTVANINGCMCIDGASGSVQHLAGSLPCVWDVSTCWLCRIPCGGNAIQNCGISIQLACDSSGKWTSRALPCAPPIIGPQGGVGCISTLGWIQAITAVCNANEFLMVIDMDISTYGTTQTMDNAICC